MNKKGKNKTWKMLKSLNKVAVGGIGCFQVQKDMV